MLKKGPFWAQNGPPLKKDPKSLQNPVALGPRRPRFPDKGKTPDGGFRPEGLKNKIYKKSFQKLP